MEDLNKIAVLIDADNTASSKIGDVLRKLSAHGHVVVKRAYGNWRKDCLKGWEAAIKNLGIKAAQQFDYAVGKNATDIALTIDALDLLHSRMYDTFVIVASDSDYTPLAIRLHESGVRVMGFGTRQALESFQNACDEFLFLEELSQEPSDAFFNPLEDDWSARFLAEESISGPEMDPFTEELAPQAERTGSELEEVHALLREAAANWQDSDGFVNLAAGGAYLHAHKPDFDCRVFGYKKLPQLLEAFPYLYDTKRYLGKGGGTVVAYRCLT